MSGDARVGADTAGGSFDGMAFALSRHYGAYEDAGMPQRCAALVMRAAKGSTAGPCRMQIQLVRDGPRARSRFCVPHEKHEVNSTAPTSLRRQSGPQTARERRRRRIFLFALCVWLPPGLGLRLRGVSTDRPLSCRRGDFAGPVVDLRIAVDVVEIGSDHHHPAHAPDHPGRRRRWLERLTREGSRHPSRCRADAVPSLFSLRPSGSGRTAPSGLQSSVRSARPKSRCPALCRGLRRLILAPRGGREIVCVGARARHIGAIEGGDPTPIRGGRAIRGGGILRHHAFLPSRGGYSAARLLNRLACTRATSSGLRK